MLSLFLLTLIFAPLAFASVEPWAYGLLQLSVFSLAAALYIKGRVNQPNPFYKNLIPALLAIALIGLLQSVREIPVNAPSALIFTAWRPGTLAAVQMWLFYAAVLFIVPQLVNSPERFKKLMWTMFAMGVAVALIGMFQKSGENTMIYGLRRVPGDAFGPFVNRDHGAYFLLMAAMAGLGLFFSGFRQLTAHQSRTRLFDLMAIQFLNLVMVAGLVYGIYRTGSRGGLHSFAAVSLLLGFASALFLKTRKARIAAWAGLVLAAAGYGFFIYSNRFMLGLKDGVFDTSVAMRFSMYKSGLAMLKDFPLFGVGLGAVEHAFPFYKLPDIPVFSRVLHVHSDWLELFLQTGLAGGLIYITGLFAALAYAFKTWRGCQSFRIKALYGGALGGVLAALMHNCVEFGSQMPANSLFLFTLLGALASRPPTLARHTYLEDEEPETERPHKKFRYAAVALAALLCLATIPGALGWLYNLKAKDANYEKKVVYQAQALKWRPDPQYAFRLGAAYYNKAIKANPPDQALLQKSAMAIAPYLKRTPLNYDLNNLNKRIIYMQARFAPI